MVGLKHHILCPVLALLEQPTPLLKRTTPVKACRPIPAINRVFVYSRRILADQAGFSLVELIAGIVILSVLAAIAVPLYIDLDDNARERAIDAGIAELNGREGLAWSNIKLTPAGWEDDVTFFNSYDKTLGNDYIWTIGPAPSGGEIKFGIAGDPVPLSRSPSTTSHPGHWTK